MREMASADQISLDGVKKAQTPNFEVSFISFNTLPQGQICTAPSRFVYEAPVLAASVPVSQLAVAELVSLQRIS